MRLNEFLVGSYCNFCTVPLLIKGCGLALTRNRCISTRMWRILLLVCSTTFLSQSFGAIAPQTAVCSSRLIDPIDSLADHLIRGRSRSSQVARREFSGREVSDGLRSLGLAHAGLKSVDKLTESFKSAARSRAFLSQRLARHRRYRSSDEKEATKLTEYMSVVERSLQAAEVLAAAGSPLGAREGALRKAGLHEVVRVENISWGGVAVSMSVMRPLKAQTGTAACRFKDNETVVALFDCMNEAGAVAATLKFLDRPPQQVNCPGSFVDEKIAVHPGVRCMAEYSLYHLASYLHSTDGAGSTSIRIIGHSVGGAVAAVASMMLGGVLPARAPRHTSTAGRNSSQLDSKQFVSMIKAYSNLDSVRCFTLGAPPCVSRGVVPSFVSSVVFGDDIFTRTTKNSMNQLMRHLKCSITKEKSRYLKYGDQDIRHTAESLSSRGAKLGYIIPKKRKGIFQSVSSLRSMARPLLSVSRTVGDIMLLGSKGIREYAAGSIYDLESLNVPGRVFYLKNKDLQGYIRIKSPEDRQMIKEFAPTILQRILRGSWREDALWRIRDITVSDSMFDDHSLEIYVAALALC